MQGSINTIELWYLEHQYLKYYYGNVVVVFKSPLLILEIFLNLCTDVVHTVHKLDTGTFIRIALFKSIKNIAFIYKIQ